MSTPLAARFRAEIEEIRLSLAALPTSCIDRPWRAGGWTGKQILGHLLDSAANNRQRFVRASIDGSYAGPGYQQESWVNAHGYAAQSWETLLRWWQVEHEILAAVVERIPEERLAAPCTIGENLPVPLEFVVSDYLLHQRHHLAQLLSA